jgi:hypothetical protein
VLGRETNLSVQGFRKHIYLRKDKQQTSKPWADSSLLHELSFCMQTGGFQWRELLEAGRTHRRLRVHLWLLVRFDELVELCM